MAKNRTIIAFTLILLCLLTLTAVSVQPVRAQYLGDITINSNGSIAPSTAPIQQTGNVYTLTGNIDGYVVLEQSNCVLDGAGHTIKGLTGPKPVQVGMQYQVDSVTAVTIINIVVNGGGIIFYGLKSNNVVIANNTLNNGSGIDWSGNDSLIKNNTVNFGRGISCGGNGNTVSENHLLSCNYTFAENNPPPYGISITGSSNIIFANTISETKGDAFHLIVGVSKNVIAGNQIISNRVGVHTVYMMSQGGAEGNLFYDNNFIGNNQNVYNEAIVTTVGSANFWDNGKEGNYWSDYNGKGPYVINTYNVDHYPLAAPVDISKLSIDSLTPAPVATPTSTSTTTPTATLTPIQTASPSPTPTVPEFSTLAVLPVLIYMFFIAVIARLKKQKQPAV